MFIFVNGLHGRDIYLNTDNICYIFDDGGKRVIYTNTGPVYVKDTFEDLVEKVDNACKRLRK